MGVTKALEKFLRFHDGELFVDIAVLNLGLINTLGGLQILPNPVGISGVITGPTVIYFSMTKNLSDNHKPHKIIYKGLQKTYYKLRGKELEDY